MSNLEKMDCVSHMENAGWAAYYHSNMGWHQQTSTNPKVVHFTVEVKQADLA